MNRKLFLTLSVGAVLATVVTACSSSSHTSSSATTAPAGSSASSGSTSATPTGAPIKIGFIADDTINGSPGVFGSDIPNTTKRWQDYVNSHGGINGHPVQVIEKDSSTTSAIALQDFQALQSDGAIVIGDFSYVDKAFEQQADAAHIPVVGSVADANPVYVSDPNFFPTVSTIVLGPWAFGQTTKLAGVHKLAVIYCAEVAGCAQYAQVLKQEGPQFGYNVTYTGSFSASSPNYTAQCLAAKGSGADGLFVSASSITAGQRVLDNCAQQGWKPTTLIGALNASMLADKNIVNAVVPDPVQPWFVQSAAMAPLHQAMDSFIPQATDGGTVVSRIWENLDVIATAATRGIPAGATPSSQGIYTGLYTFKNETLGGIAPPLTYTQGQPGQINCTFVFAFGNGRPPSTPYGSAPICKTPAA